MGLAGGLQGWLAGWPEVYRVGSLAGQGGLAGWLAGGVTGWPEVYKAGWQELLKKIHVFSVIS